MNLGNKMFYVLLAAALAGCAPDGDGRYVGTVVTTQGACGLGFDAQGKSTATLMMRSGQVQFAPSDGVVILPGHVDGTGHVLAGSSAIGADKKPFPQVFDGKREGGHVSGTYATPRCRASVDLSAG